MTEQQSAKKRRKSGVKAAGRREQQQREPSPAAEEHVDVQAAAAAVDEGPTGWEELEAPQDVQQQAGEHMQAVSRACRSAWVLPQRPGRLFPKRP